MSCTNGAIQSYIPSLLLVLIFAELLYYLIRLTVIMVGNFFEYDFSQTYWDVIDITVPPVAVMLFSIIIQKYGEVSNMFPDSKFISGLRSQ